MSRHNGTATVKPGDYWLTAAQSSTGLHELLQELEQGHAAQQTMGVPELDDAISLHPGTLTLLVARPGHGKTTVAKALAIRECQRIQAEGESNERVVFATLEEDYRVVWMAIAGIPYTVDEIFRGQNVDWEKAKKAALYGVQQPCEIIAHPRVKKGLRPPALSSKRLFDAMEVMKAEHDVKPTLVLVDYGQLLREDAPGDFRHQMVEAAQACHDLALRLECAVVAGIQASRKTDSRMPPVPELEDLAESAQWERAAENVLSLWRPIRTHKDRRMADASPEPIKISGRNYPVTENLLVIKILKQRYRAGHGIIPVHMAPTTYRLTGLAEEQPVATHWSG